MIFAMFIMLYKFKDNNRINRKCYLILSRVIKLKYGASINQTVVRKNLLPEQSVSFVNNTFYKYIRETRLFIQNKH